MMVFGPSSCRSEARTWISPRAETVMTTASTLSSSLSCVMNLIFADAGRYPMGKVATTVSLETYPADVLAVHWRLTVTRPPWSRQKALRAPFSKGIRVGPSIKSCHSGAFASALSY